MLSEKKRMILRIMFLKMVYGIRIRKKEKKVRLVLLNFVKEKIISKTILKMITLRNNLIRL